MLIGVSVISSCLLFSIMLLFLYFSKQRINSMENKIYGVLVVINVIGLVLELLCCYFTYYNGTNSFNTLMCFIVNRIFVLYMLTWLSVFAFYIFYITYSQNERVKNNLHIYEKRFVFCGIFIYVILFTLVMFLPINYFNDGKYVYSYGPATSMVLIFGVISIIFDIFCVVKNRKNIYKRQLYPLFALIFLLTIASIIRNINPGIILINSMFAFITFLMFHTIENPDVKMMEELYKNKKLIEKTNEDTANFLFRMTQDIKKPIRDIIEVSDDMITIDDLSDLKDGSKIVNNKAKELDYLVNDALDVSLMSTKTIKIYDTRYNPINLFKEIKYQTENKLNNNVKFEYSVSNNIPSYLYGDSIKLKQIIYSILENSVQNTEEGFISLDINSIIKYDVCRLIINISDSGKGISIDEVNNILSLNIEDLAKINLTKEEKILNLKEVKKLTMVLGGNLIVKSEEGKGTTVSITIDQKIVPTKEKEISKKLDLYEQSLQKNKKIMVVDDDTKELSKITSYLENQEMHVSGSLFGRDVIDKIKSKHKFDLIILDDETNTISAYEVLKELKKDENFNIPVVVMIDDNKEFIKLHFMQDGFFDVIMKSKLNSELDRILKRL